MGKVSQWWCWWCWWWWCFRDGASIWVRPGAAGNGFCWSWEGNSRGTESGTRLAWQHRHVERQVLDQCAQSLHGWRYVVDILYLTSVPSLHGRWYVVDTLYLTSVPRVYTAGGTYLLDTLYLTSVPRVYTAGGTYLLDTLYLTSVPRVYTAGGM